MIAGGLKNKIDSLWEIFWTGGYYARYSASKYFALFKIPTPLMLDKIVTAIEGIYEMM